VVDALSEANGFATASDMIATGGATLTNHVGTGSVAAALAAQDYSHVVLQERGGDFVCGWGPMEACENARTSLATLVRLAQEHEAVPILLGTYQGSPESSKAIEVAESQAASEAGLDYVPVSERFRQLRELHPEMTWFAPDDMHPGSDLTLLEAILLFERIHGVRPGSSALVVSAPIYESMSYVPPEVRAAGAPIEQLDVPSSAQYESARIVAVLESLK
jgi:hypothetical protein